MGYKLALSIFNMLAIGFFLFFLFACILSIWILRPKIVGALRKAQVPESQPILVEEEDEDNAEEMGTVRAESDKVEVVLLPMDKKTKKTKSKDKTSEMNAFEMVVFNEAFDEEKKKEEEESSKNTTNISMEI